MNHEQGDKKIVIYWNWRTIVNWILLIILVPIFAIFLASLTMKNTIANPNFYKNNLNEANAYNRLINDGIPSLIMDATITDNETSNFLAKQGIIFVIQKAVSPDWVREKVDMILDKTAEFFAKPEKEPSITVKLDDFDANLATINDGLVVLNQFIPTCEEAKNNTDAKLINIPIDCDSMNVSLDQIKTDITNIQSKISNISTKNIELTHEIEKVFDSINLIRNYIVGLSIALWSSLVLSIIIIIALIVINMKALTHIVRSITLSLGIGGFSILIFSIIKKSLIDPNIANNIDLKISYTVRLIITDIVKTNIDNFFNYLITLSSVVLVLMIAINIAMLILKKYKVIK